MSAAQPSVLLFDVNETLVDIDALSPLFQRVFGDARVMREWFGQLVMYSMTVTLSGRYVDYLTLAQHVLGMLADIHRVDITDADTRELRAGMLTMPAHPDAVDGLTMLRNKGYRLATLTNSPPNPDGPSVLEHAGLVEFFEQQFSVDAVGAFKPAPAVYRHACRELEVAPAACMMVAAHMWDTVGAQSAGLGGALITRPGNARLPGRGLPQPALVAADLREFAGQLPSAHNPTT